MYKHLHKLKYGITNENIDSIISGLDLKPEDSVLAIGGSGDQAFAILEYALHVTAVDIDEYQSQYIRYRKEMLKKADYAGFIFSNIAPIEKYHLKEFDDIKDFVRRKYFKDKSEEANRSKYFLNKNRLEKIRMKLNNLNVQEGDIFSNRRKLDKFNKIYLSNALDWSHRTGDESSRAENGYMLLKFWKKLKAHTLVYIARGEDFVENCTKEIKYTQIPDLSHKSKTPYRNSDIYGIHNWEPIVIEKIPR